jgi:hypothetical protein
MAEALKPGAPLAFTYHHNSIEAYYPLAVAILDAGLVCSASLPCPAEMGASIHINRTGSSIIDTVFVCRSTGRVSRRIIVATAEGIAELVREDLGRLRDGGISPTRGDARCVAFGHMIRLAIWNLRETWPRAAAIQDKIRLVGDIIRSLGGVARMEELLPNDLSRFAGVGHKYVREPELAYGADAYEIPF